MSRTFNVTPQDGDVEPLWHTRHVSAEINVNLCSFRDENHPKEV